jgi:hypothetical protein
MCNEPKIGDRVIVFDKIEGTIVSVSTDVMRDVFDIDVEFTRDDFLVVFPDADIPSIHRTIIQRIDAMFVKLSRKIESEQGD